MKCPLPNEIISQTINTTAFSLQEIRGGISKQVYKIIVNSNSYVLYIWLRPYDGNLTENKTEGIDYLFPDGFKYFIYNTRLLADIGVHVPQIINYGHYEIGAFDYAVVEYLKGQSFQEYMDNGNDISLYSDKMVKLMEKLSVLNRHYYGSPMEICPFSLSSEQLAFNFYTEELKIASDIDNEISDARDHIYSLLQTKMSEIPPVENPAYSLIHGELTPPHIFILEDDSLALIDIESVKYYDTEFDWAVIDLMYDGKILLPKTLDYKKLGFYKLCLRIGYLSTAADYLVHVDKKNAFFTELRKDTLYRLLNS